VLKNSPDQALEDLRKGESAIMMPYIECSVTSFIFPNLGDLSNPPVLLSPILLGCQTKNAKVVAIAVGSLQRLVGVKGAITAVRLFVKLAPLRTYIDLIGLVCWASQPYLLF
jgi:hypothetical protein